MFCRAMGRGRPKHIGQFAWIDADIGVECRRCGRVTVYCDFEAADCFRERGWSTAVDDTVKRFRCRCGSADVRLAPVPIFKRPKPVPVRPAALRPIYAEEARQLARRGPSVAPDPAVIEAALDVLRSALERFKQEDVRDERLSAALATLRPHCYRTQEIDRFADAVAPGRDALTGGTAAHHAFTGILRQLGRPRD